MGAGRVEAAFEPAALASIESGFDLHLTEPVQMDVLQKLLSQERPPS